MRPWETGTELFEALRKRRSIRDFNSDEVPDEVLRKLVYAANRAPTGGNASYRRVVVVRDMKMIELIKQVSPGILGNPAALMAICTDLDLAYEQLGRLGRNICSILDAGAAAENVTLAATAMGVGSCFTKSYSETAVKELLKMPDGYRVEVILQLGYPKKLLPPPSKPRKGAGLVYVDRFGVTW